MKASTMRAVTWTATAIVGAAGLSQGVLFWVHSKERLYAAQPGEIRQGLRETSKGQVVVRRKVDDYYAIKDVNVSGVAPAPEVAESQPASSPATVFNPLDKILSLRGTQVHETDPALSAAWVSWIDPQIADSVRQRRNVLREGDAFPEPYRSKWELRKIEVKRALFFNKDEAKEYVQKVPEFESAPTTSRPAGGSGVASAESSSRPAGYGVPAETKKVSETELWLSQRDYEDLERNGLEMMGREVQTAAYLDPKTRRPAGLRVTVIRPNSVASRFGLKEGDIVKELNGSAIRSTSDVYAYAQEHPGVKSVQLSIERYGRPITITYVLP
jgi:PDZ domain-containing protein